MGRGGRAKACSVFDRTEPAMPAGMVVALGVVSLVVSMMAPDWDVQAGSAGLASRLA